MGTFPVYHTDVGTVLCLSHGRGNGSLSVTRTWEPFPACHTDVGTVPCLLHGRGNRSLSVTRTWEPFPVCHMDIGTVPCLSHGPQIMSSGAEIDCRGVFSVGIDFGNYVCVVGLMIENVFRLCSCLKSL